MRHRLLVWSLALCSVAGCDALLGESGDDPDLSDPAPSEPAPEAPPPADPPAEDPAPEPSGSDPDAGGAAADAEPGATDAGSGAVAPDPAASAEAVPIEPPRFARRIEGRQLGGVPERIDGVTWIPQSFMQRRYQVELPMILTLGGEWRDDHVRYRHWEQHTDKIYILEVLEYPQPTDEMRQPAFLDRIRDGFIEGEGGRIEAPRAIRVGEHLRLRGTAARYAARRGGGVLHGEVAVVRDGQRFLVFAMARQGTPVPIPTFSHYLESFDIPDRAR